MRSAKTVYPPASGSAGSGLQAISQQPVQLRSIPLLFACSSKGCVMLIPLPDTSSFRDKVFVPEHLRSDAGQPPTCLGSATQVVFLSLPQAPRKLSRERMRFDQTGGYFWHVFLSWID